jgi:serine/threonine protein kinase
VQLLQSLRHPHIIEMLDSFIEDNELIIVFEWALGGDLKRLIRRQIEAGVPMDESLIWGHFTQVPPRSPTAGFAAEALACAQGENISINCARV